MLQIYLSNIPISTIKMNTLSQFLHKKFENSICYSEENGIFIEEKGSIHYIEPSFDEKYEQIDYLKNIMIVQHSTLNKIKVLSQMPLNYILHKRTVNEYKISEKSMLKLVVISINENYDEYKILDFYFECAKNDFNIDNIFFQEELNRFLSVLN